VTTALLFTLLMSQDIFERARQRDGDRPAPTATYSGRDRLDLRVSADLQSAALTPQRGSGRIGVQADLDVDFACGKFDIGASLRSLVSKSARDEYLGAIMGLLESELTKNALVLACEASPTICQAIQHYKVQAQAMLSTNYDRCRGIEQALGDALEKQKADSIKACLEEKRRAGIPMDRALDECQGANGMRSLNGARVQEIDLLNELTKALKLTPEQEQNVQRLLSNRVTYTPRGGRGEIAKSAVEEEYRRARDRYSATWQAAVDQVERSQAPSDKTMSALAPPGAPGVSRTELAELALLPASLRDVLVSSVASQSALLEMVRRVHEVERDIEAARKLPTAGEVAIQKLERERTDLRAEVARLIETHERQNEFNRTLLAALSVARQHVATNAASALDQLALERRRAEVRRDTQKWGAGLDRQTDATAKKAQQVGPGCGNCGGTSWSFGTAGGRK